MNYEEIFIVQMFINRNVYAIGPSIVSESELERHDCNGPGRLAAFKNESETWLIQPKCSIYYATCFVRPVAEVAINHQKTQEVAKGKY